MPESGGMRETGDQTGGTKYSDIARVLHRRRKRRKRKDLEGGFPGSVGIPPSQRPPSGIPVTKEPSGVGPDAGGPNYRSARSSRPNRQQVLKRRLKAMQRKGY